MPGVFITAQTAPIVANAGVTQTVSIGGSPTSFALGGFGTGTIQGAGGGGTQSGPGWATIDNTSTGTPSTATTGFDKSKWPIYLFIAALAYFGFQKLK